MDSPESPRVKDEGEKDSEEEELQKSFEIERHQLNENVVAWIKQFKVNFCNYVRIISLIVNILILGKPKHDHILKR